MQSTANWLDREDATLAAYAVRTRHSRGRRHPEPPHPLRPAFQRDRDRVLHSAAFRRLMHKTQMLAAPTNDHHRTRLTHTLEVAQLSRTLARALGLNEDLTETIALAHDLGHPPFGHAGEAALDACLADHGGFEHNGHGLRLVETLERRYPDFPGLNLSFEVLEALARRSKRPDVAAVADLVGPGMPPLEAQVVEACDSLAYDTHDLDDAWHAGLIDLGDLAGVEFWNRAADQVRRSYVNLSAELFVPAVVRTLIDWQVTDLLNHTRDGLAALGVAHVDDVRAAPRLLVTPSAEVARLKDDLETFLHRRVYQHPRVVRMSVNGDRIVRRLFEAFGRRPELLPPEARPTEQGPRAVGDYLAGLTDRSAAEEYRRLFHPAADW